jgi:hypothetical protein
MSKKAVRDSEFVSPAAERMRRCRQRKREGFRLHHVLLREFEINALIDSGLLEEKSRDDHIAVTEALHRFFDRTLGRMKRSIAIR